MNKDIFYACYLNPVTPAELDIISKYWELDEDSYYPYRYRIREIGKENRKVKQSGISEFVVSNSFITSNSKKFSCPSCFSKKNAKNRTQLLELTRLKVPSLCEVCNNQEVNKIAVEKIERLRSLTASLPLPVFEESSFQKLSYLNKLALISMLVEVNSLNKASLRFTKDELMLSGSDDSDESILRELFDKDAIHIIDEHETMQSHFLYDARTYFKKNLILINTDILLQFNKLDEEIPKPGLYFPVPTCFDGFEEYRAYLFEAVSCASLTESDVQAIRQVVISNRLNCAYQLLSEVLKTNKIPVDDGIRLDSLLVALVREYPLKIAYNILNYQARLVAATLYSNPKTPYYVQGKLLPKFVADYMERQRAKGLETYSRNLPNYMIGSKIEHFSSYYILGELVDWTELSADQVIEKWLNSPTVKLIV